MGSTKIETRLAPWTEDAIKEIEIPPQATVHALVFAPEGRGDYKALIARAEVVSPDNQLHLFVLIYPIR